MTDAAAPVSVILTVRNEAATVGLLLDSLAAQTRPPDEVVIVDGGSTDGTLDAIRSWGGGLPICTISLPGANISQGRNAAITAAAHGLIVATDAGVTLEHDWLERLTAPFAAMPTPDVVSGFFVPAPETTFEIALGATTLPDVDEVNPAGFLPSSRSVAFRRGTWEAVGGYPEWLDYCEDLVFDLALRAAGFRFAFAPNAVVHFRPRPDLRAFWRQYYRYARGDGKADLWRKRHAARYLTYLVLTPGLLALAALHTPWWLLALPVGGAAYLKDPYRRVWRSPHFRRLSLAGKLAALGLVPVIRLVGDVAKMVGYPVGVRWRLRQDRPVPQQAK